MQVHGQGGDVIAERAATAVSSTSATCWVRVGVQILIQIIPIVPTFNSCFVAHLADDDDIGLFTASVGPFAVGTLFRRLVQPTLRPLVLYLAFAHFALRTCRVWFAVIKTVGGWQLLCCMAQELQSEPSARVFRRHRSTQRLHLQYDSCTCHTSWLSTGSACSVRHLIVRKSVLLAHGPGDGHERHQVRGLVLAGVCLCTQDGNVEAASKCATQPNRPQSNLTHILPPECLTVVGVIY